MNNQTLINAGLSPEQSEIYLSLLDHGGQTAISLAKTTKVKRTYVYKICQELAQQNLINIQTHGRTTTFYPLSPNIILNKLSEKKTQIESAEIGINQLLPSLLSKYRLIDQKPVITYYEGIEGIKKVYLDTLTENKPILALVETTKVHPEIYKWVTKTYAPMRVKQQMSVKAIVTTGQKTDKYTNLNQAELRETKIVDSKNFPFEHEINIYGNKVAIIDHNAKDPLIGIIIDSLQISTTFRSWFNLTWNKLK
jgi:sugar-specific transcriptional regulator TrmB